MILRGDRCRCSACGRLFNSTYMFDKHRRGAYPNRRCMDVIEMRGRGYALSPAGFWISEERPTETSGEITRAEIA